jgi:hypothetical protein
MLCFSMTFTLHKSQVHTIREGEKNFTIQDGFVSYPRAMIHVLPGAPTNVAQTLNWAIAQGYVKAVAHVTERELIFMGLSK